MLGIDRGTGKDSGCSVAFRMLGRVADADDVVQDAFVRSMQTDRAAVREPEAFLRRTVAPLYPDQLKSGQYQRKSYIGSWLTGPLSPKGAMRT